MKAFPAERLLARTFFGRFFESDLMPAGYPQLRLVIWGIAILAAPGYLRGIQMLIAYEQRSRMPGGDLAGAMRADALFYVTYAMLSLGLVALVVWQGVFPDRRDARIFGVLPLAARTLVVARLAALTAVAGLFCLGVNLPSSVVYGPAAGVFDPASHPLRAAAAHFAVTTASGAFAFFLVIGGQGVLLNVLGRRAAQRVALGLQVAAVVALLQMMLLLPFVGSVVSAALRGDEPRWVLLLPPTWFLALYEQAAGSARAAPGSYAAAAAIATAVAAAGSMILFAGSYGRLARLALESPEPTGRGVYRLPAGWLDGIAAGIARDPVQRAVAGFTLRTLARSRPHAMLLATYLGVGLALVVSALLPLFVRHGLAAFDLPRVPWLSAPLILAFFALCGMRVVLAIPIEIKANWMFRLYGSEACMRQVVSGVRTALLLAAVVPIGLAAGLFAAALWGGRTGAIHGAFTAALGLLLVDVLLVGLRKVPFACTYYPGRSRIRMMWPVYVVGFSTYAFTLAAVEAAALDRPAILGATLAAVAFLAAALAYFRRRDLRPPPGLTYEERDPDALFEGFSLSEGLAAESAGPSRTNRG